MSHNYTTESAQVNNHSNEGARDFIYNIPQTVLLDLTLHLVDLRVYAIVRSFMDTTRDAYFSNAWAAKKLGVEPVTVSRSISKLVKRGYIRRDEINGRRHLMVGKLIPEAQVSQRGVDLQIKGGRSIDQGGVDLQINQLDQRLLLQNNNSVVVDKLYESCDKAIPKKELSRLLSKYPESTIREKLAILKRAKNVRKPAAWLKDALQNDYFPDSEEPKKTEIGCAVPSIDETQKYLEKMYSKKSKNRG